MSSHEGDSGKPEAAEQPPVRVPETAHQESMGATVDHLERTRAQAAQQRDTENRPPNPTTGALGRPEVVGDDGKVLVKGAEPSCSATAVSTEAADPAPEGNEARQSAGTDKQDDSDVPVPSKELMDAYGSQSPDDIWKQMGAMADQIDSMPAGPEKDAKARQYNDMNTVYRYLRSREQSH